MQAHASAERLVVVHRLLAWLRQTETWIYRQIADLPSDIESHVVCDWRENEAQFPHPHVHSFDRAAPWRKALERVARSGKLHGARQLALVAVGCNASVLHSHFGNEAFRALPVARALGLPHVVTFYGYDVSQLPRIEIWRRRYRELFASVQRVLCEGPYMREALVALGCPAQVARVHHLGVDLEAFDFEPRRWASGQVLRVLIAGSFREKKGIPFAVRALGELRRRRPALKLSVVIVGGAGKSEEQQRERRRIDAALADSELGDRVELRGYQPHEVLREEARRAHLFLSPSVVAENGDSEGGAPVAIIEMAASGMPIVSTQHCDIPNVLRGRASQYLAPERDVPALVACLERLIDAPHEWHDLALEVRRDLEGRFDSRRQALALSEHYRELAASPRSLPRADVRVVSAIRARLR